MSWAISGVSRAPTLFQIAGTPSAAYSLRQLNLVDQNVVRVRRSSDNTESDFTAAQVTDGTLTTFCGAGNGFVRTWYDQSGNGRNATQTDTTLQPTIVSNGSLLLVNDKPAVNFNASPFLTSTLQLAFPFSAFWTVYPNSNPVSNLDRFAGHNGFGQFRYASARLGGWFNAELNGPVLAGAAQHQNTWLAINNGLINTAANGSSLFETTGAFVIEASAFSLGRATTGNPFSGLIQEGVVYLSDQSTNRAAIEANINAHYAIY